MSSLRHFSAALGSAVGLLALASVLAATSHAHHPVSVLQPASSIERVQQSDRRDEARDASRSLLDADAQLTGGNLALAIEAYEGVIARYPNSQEAVTARRRILEARALLKSPTRNEPFPSVTLQPKPERPPALVSAPPAPTPRSLPPSTVAQRQNDEFKAAVADRIFFARNSAELAPAEIHVLRLQAHWLLQRRDISLWIEARADDGDSAEIDTALALERGSAVKSFLIKEGVEAKRIRVAVLGRERPVALCEALVAKALLSLDPAAIDAAEACAAHNRSVITVVGPEGLAYEPKIAETPRSREAEAKRKNLSERESPLRQ